MEYKPGILQTIAVQALGERDLAVVRVNLEQLEGKPGGSILGCCVLPFAPEIRHSSLEDDGPGRQIGGEYGEVGPSQARESSQQYD